MEIRFNIAEYLSTADFLNIRLSSKAFVCLFESQQFWRTRFWIHRKRGYLNFLAEQGYQDWRLLYRYTCSSSKIFWPRKLNDWRRQWLTNENIRDRYMMAENTGGLSTASSLKLENSSDSFHWVKIPIPYSFPCRLPSSWQRQDFHNESLSTSKFASFQCGRCGRQACSTKVHIVPVSRPLAISKIAVSVLLEDESTYISGFDLIYGSDIPKTQFGYSIPGKQVMLDLQGQILKGFEVQIQRLAIRALRPVTEGDQALAPTWAGNLDTRYSPILKSVRLASNDSIAAISGDFQVS